MQWTDMTRNWGTWYRRLQTRFPHLDDGAMPYAKVDRSLFEAYLAETHNLSVTEAREEIDDFLFVEKLARECENEHEAERTRGGLSLIRSVVDPSVSPRI